MASTSTVIDYPIINSPSGDQKRHYRFGDAGVTNEVVKERRTNSYFILILPPKKKSKQLSLDTEWLGERVKENELINRMR